MPQNKVEAVRTMHNNLCRMERLATIMTVLVVGCSHGGETPRPATRQSEPHGNTTAAVQSAPADPFWHGLERHEIQLGQTLLVVKGSRGIVACPYLNIETFAKGNEACAIVPAVNIDGMPDSRVTAVTPQAEALGITVGMSGREALEKIR